MRNSASLKNETVLLVTEREYLGVLLQCLAVARSSVDIVAFSFVADVGATSRLANAPTQIAHRLIQLKQMHKKKISIRLYLEGHRETAERNQLTARFLKKAGIEIQFGSTHAKGFCVDGRYIVFGSTNLTQQSITRNNETNVFIDDVKIATTFLEYFNHLWRGGMHGSIILDPPFIADGGFKEALIQMINAAQARLEFSIYFFDQKEIEEALIAAHKRGVKITGFVHDHKSFALSYVRRTANTVKRLRAAGIKDLHFGPSHLFTHSKYLIRDGKEIALGTGNWLDQDVNIHPQLYLRFLNQKLCVQLAKHLQTQIQGGP